MPTELRVHGVSGTPPSELLYTNPVTYDQGPDLAKIYERSRDSWDVRAFHWGSLTSQSSLTAFWILLAPFAMANVAGWMSESPNVWSRVWIRIAGLSLTGILYAQLANMAFDVPLASGIGDAPVKWAYVALCLVSVIGLGLLSTQSSFRHIGLRERLGLIFKPTIGAMIPHPQASDVDDPANDFRMVGTKMWTVHSIVHRLRRLHLGLGMAVLAIVAARATGDAGAEIAGHLVAALALVTTGLTAGGVAKSRSVLLTTAFLPLVAAAALVWAVSGLAMGEIASENVADTLTFQLSLILGAGAGLGLAGELIVSRLRNGWVPLGLLAVAALVGATLGLTGSMLVETYLTGSSSTTETFDNGASFVTVAMLGMALAMGIAFGMAILLPRSSDANKRNESPFRRGMLRSRVILTTAGVYGVGVGAGAVWASCSGSEAGCTQRNISMPDWVLEDSADLVVLLGLPFDPTSLMGWAKLLMVAVPAVLIGRSIVSGLLNGQESRRRVGILWDLGSFWPRWFHPLGPPAYGPYAVTRLASTIHSDPPDVLAAHSQGSLIAITALSLVRNDDSPRRLITYGSQIGDLYPSLFPAVGFDELVEEASRQVEGRWINLWRPSDVVGGQVIEALGDRNWRVDTGRGHSRYELTPEFGLARERLGSNDNSPPPIGDVLGYWKTL